MIASDPPGATITTRGARGIAPATFTLTPGDYDVAAALPGYDPAHQTARLELGQTRTLTLHLQEIRRPWWTRHKTKVYVGGALLVAAAAAFGAYKLFEPDYGHTINFP